jgi:hypothetical protein
MEHVEPIAHILRGQQSLLGARETMNPGAATRDATVERMVRHVRRSDHPRGVAHRVDLDGPAGARPP